MKQALTSLTLAASLMASGASAFEQNYTYIEESKLRGLPTVGDLSVGVRGLLDAYSIGCKRNGKLYLSSNDRLQTDPRDYSGYYQIIKQVDGEFIVTYRPESGDNPRFPGLHSGDCDKQAERNPALTFYPVKNINGFTDTKSLIIDLINQGYK